MTGQHLCRLARPKARLYSQDRRSPDACRRWNPWPHAGENSSPPRSARVAATSVVGGSGDELSDFERIDQEFQNAVKKCQEMKLPAAAWLQSFTQAETTIWENLPDLNYANLREKVLNSHANGQV